MTLGRDIRFALRALRGAPLVSVLAISCIGLGIGAVTTVYSTANAFTFRPLPQLHDPGRLMLVAETLVGAVALGRSMRAILVDTSPTDPAILGGAASLLALIALLAGWLPARRASRVDPVAALRAD